MEAKIDLKDKNKDKKNIVGFLLNFNMLYVAFVPTAFFIFSWVALITEILLWIGIVMMPFILIALLSTKTIKSKDPKVYGPYIHNVFKYKIARMGMWPYINFVGDIIFCMLFFYLNDISLGLVFLIMTLFHYKIDGVIEKSLDNMHRVAHNEKKNKQNER